MFRAKTSQRYAGGFPYAGDWRRTDAKEFLAPSRLCAKLSYAGTASTIDNIRCFAKSLVKILEYRHYDLYP
jgi:hypothetical protein